MHIPQCCRQVVSNDELVVGIFCSFVDNNSLLRSTNSQDACLRRVDNGREVLNAEHTQVGNCESTRLKSKKKIKYIVNTKQKKSTAKQTYYYPQILILLLLGA